jgi:predicted CXXCH cytochrome family protein
LKRNLLISFTVVFTLFCSSCSNQSGYKILSFFMDGVPEPGSKEILAAVDSLEGYTADSLVATRWNIQRTEYFMHMPYLDKDCMKCHSRESYGDIRMPEPDLCYSCHTDFREEKEYLHGPVDLGFCTSCHEPHMSRQDKLLKEEGPSLCYLCHMKEEVLESDSHRRIADRVCSECHDPHGGDNHSLLLPGYARTRL